MNYIVKGEGRPFLFQHGLGSNKLQPQRLLSELNDVQLISMDCPGHGEAPLLQGTLPSFNYYTDQIIELMLELNIKKAIFGGISMGAGIALNMAIRYPEKVKGLVLVRPAWLNKKSPENLSILLEATRYIDQLNGKQNFEKKQAFKAIQRVLPNAALSVLGVFAETQRSEIAKVLENMVNDCPFNHYSELKSINPPCLIIGNEDDLLHPYKMAEVLHQNISNSLLEKVVSRYLDDAQHKKTVTQLVSKFIENI